MNRSCFALVQQVAYAYSVKPELLSLRELLKKSADFYWDKPLQIIFDDCKQHIADMVEQGIRTYDKDRYTCLATDWCKDGIGYWLLQKYCKCDVINPTCCSGGWKLCLVGSRFCIPAETNYSPTEGEALAVADALHRTKHFTLGCKKLIVATDHKPLLGILNSKPLEKIDNPRLLRLKEKTLLWNFEIIYVPGTKLCGPDALSRHATADEREVLYSIRQAYSYPPDHEITDISTYRDTSDQFPIGGADSEILASYSTTMKAVSWNDLVEFCTSDSTTRDLEILLTNGFPLSKQLLPAHLQPYWRIREEIEFIEGVPIYNNRTIIPKIWRARILEILHSAHQGVTGMTQRATQSVYWPGINEDIIRTRSSCHTCNQSAPSQPSLPPVTQVIPEYPFQHAVSDFFHKNGKQYGVYGDRFSGWVSIYNKQKSSITSFIRDMCTHHGIPETLSTDGGPEYMSGEFQQMLKDLQIEHRVSSAYFPHSNCRAEIAVKSMKRLMNSNISQFGDIDNDNMLRALLQHRNTPDRDTGLSPAQVILGRPLRDFIPMPPGSYRPAQYKLSHTWKSNLQAREIALQTRSKKMGEIWSEHTRNLPPLKVGDHVYVQNQHGQFPLKWDRRGVVVEVKQNHQYNVRLDGSRQTTLRNRKFLRRLTPVSQKEPVRDEIPIVASPGTPTEEVQQPRPPPTPPTEHPPLTPSPASRTYSEVASIPPPAPHPTPPPQTQPTTTPSTPGRSPPSPSRVPQSPVSTRPSPPRTQDTSTPRRSTRLNRGETTRYKDYVE